MASGFFSSPQIKTLPKNKSLSARTHNEVKMNNDNYIEQLKRLNVYDELLALKKLPTSKINTPATEKPGDFHHQPSEKILDIKKSIIRSLKLSKIMLKSIKNYKISNPICRSRSPQFSNQSETKTRLTRRSLN